MRHSSFNQIPVRWLAAAGLLVLLLAAGAAGQELPDTIRGYKVYKAKVSIAASPQQQTVPADGREASVTLGRPELVRASIAGVSFDVGAEIAPQEQSGRIDFLTFHDFRVNGLAVSIDEYREPLELRKGRPALLPRPVRLYLNTGEALRGALGELRDSKEMWTVTGRVFVFGRFRKYGLTFKRVVPVDVNVTIRNPLRDRSQ